MTKKDVNTAPLEASTPPATPLDANTSTLATRMMNVLEREHELSKMAKEISVGLPIREDSARAIAARIGNHPLAMAAFGSWIEALQEAIEDSVASVAFGSGHGSAEKVVIHMLRERLDELSRQAEQITSRLSKGGRPPERSLVGASGFDDAATPSPAARTATQLQDDAGR